MLGRGLVVSIIKVLRGCQRRFGALKETEMLLECGTMAGVCSVRFVVRARPRRPADSNESSQG